jgi:hypothetical protein
MLTLDTQTNNEKLMVTGTTTATALHVDVGTSLFDEKVTIGAGAGAMTLTNTAASMVLNDNDSSAFDIGSAGATSLVRVSTLDAGGSVTISGTAGQTVLSVPVGESSFVEGVAMPIAATALAKIRFCGNGPNATTATYVGPVLDSDYGTDMSFGGTGCDGKDNTTEATADAVWSTSFAFKPVAMVCSSTCGTDDVMTAQLRDDTANVTGMTCDITLNGTAAQCSVRDASPATVAAGSTIAVKLVNGTDDNCSSGDVECLLFITF